MESSSRINHHQYHGGKNSASSSYSVWSNFFLAAGIPSTVANEYAVTFSQHRIQINMLKEINKEILLDMGIKAMGDIIAILRHAKDLCTQDELKSGGLKVVSAMDDGELLQNHSVPSINQRTSVTTSRLAPNISSLVGSKISTRLGEDVGRSSISTPSLVGKRPNNISYVESKRLRLDQNKPQQQQVAPGNEKTLTVRYPSVEVMAKVQQRMFEARAGSNPNTGNHQSSIKSRLGGSRLQSSTQSPSTSQINNKSFPNRVGQQQRLQQQQHQQRRLNSLGNGTGEVNRSNTHDSGSKYSANRKSNVFARDDMMRSKTNRLKSTVFNRLGEGPG